MLSTITDPLTVQHPLVTVMKVNQIEVIENFGLVSSHKAIEGGLLTALIVLISL